MRSDSAMLALHGSAAAFALAAALAWPRAGQAALLVPVGGQDLASVIAFAAREEAPLLALDSAGRRVIARMDDARSPLRALAAGILPIAASARGCTPSDTRSS